jgi:thiamine-phosphate pyrophosphorylase
MSAEALLHPFYPIVPDFGWIARIVPLGVRTVQLRLKHAGPDEVRRQIGDSLEVCARYGCTLIVNDYWHEAIDCDSKFLHLGQEDLAAANLAAIRAAGLKLGVSTHSHAELSTALAADPDYVALGPVYETTLKKMPWAPQGLDRLRDWVETAGRPVVAIGGITLERAPAVYATGVASIAVVSDVIASPDPARRVVDWLRLADGRL